MGSSDPEFKSPMAVEFIPGGVFVTLQCFDFPADQITCLLVEWFALAGPIVWVADGRLFFADYVVFPCET